MKKKLALIIISIDECFPQKGFSGGGHKVTKHLIEGLVESSLFDIDIYSKKSNIQDYPEIKGIQSITVIGKKSFEKKLKAKLNEKKYDYILSSDILLPFANNLVHSNSSKHKTKNGKNPFMQWVLNFYNFKKIKVQEKNMPRSKAVFTVSESLKNDYVENFNLDKNKVFVCHPAVDSCTVDFIPGIREYFTVGSIAGGGLNKGGWVLVLALAMLKKHKIKARVIFPKWKKVLGLKLAVKALGLEETVEIIPKQKDMNEYYKSIDCYILPSLNEAFGLVVTEAASNCRPSIVSSTTGVRELIVDNENGFVFNRTKAPVKSLTKKIKEVSEIYFNDNSKFSKVSQKASEIPKRLDWKKFTDKIIYNMVKEN